MMLGAERTWIVQGMPHLWWLLVIFGTVVRTQEQIKVLTSLLKLEDANNGINGAKLISNDRVNISDITLCIRFNIKVLGRNEGQSRIITIEDWREDGAVRSGYLLTGSSKDIF